MSKVPHRLYLSEQDLPGQYYNIRADMKTKPAPLIHPGTREPLGEEELAPIFCREVIRQELNNDDPYIDIPEPVQEYYRTFRPSPLCRAYHLERALDTPAKIYYKFEGNNTSGSHKLTSAAAQVYYAKQQGVTELTTETGAGQWGTAVAMSCAYFGLDLTVFMVQGSYDQKPFRKHVMETYGAKVIPSPSAETQIGRKIREEYPDTAGSLGCAISEAVEKSVSGSNCRYVLGSVLNHVLLHQSVIGLEAKKAMERIGEYPDIVIGCAGGGSNLGGLMAPFMQDKLKGLKSPYFIAVEPASCPTLTRGRFLYDFCDTGCVTPLAQMYTLGSHFIPSANHAGGLRFHGMSPVLSRLYADGVLDKAIAVEQTPVFEAAVAFAKAETILPAPESAHAIYAAIEEALKCKESGQAKTILFGLSGTGYFDLNAYAQYSDKTMRDHVPTDEELEASFARIPQ
ncbi:MAG: TrpB-like pyridoxal phosphate-dependent enzyme [Oscillospiraceae bacterium]|nr:TrpB-like pyridoxal phosphate-dependent enzyme [Oscillospiraceae bacterium]